MTKLIVAFCLIVSVSQAVLAETDIRIQMLDAQIEKLEQERAQKLSDLQQCEKQSKNFKIAGLSTLALTGVGVYANVKLNEKLKKQGSKYHGASGNSNMVDTRPQSDKDCSSIKELLELGLATQEEVDETCNN